MKIAMFWNLAKLAIWLYKIVSANINYVQLNGLHSQCFKMYLSWFCVIRSLLFFIPFSQICIKFSGICLLLLVHFGLPSIKWFLKYLSWLLQVTRNFLDKFILQNDNCSDIAPVKWSRCPPDKNLPVGLSTVSTSQWYCLRLWWNNLTDVSWLANVL